MEMMDIPQMLIGILGLLPNAFIAGVCFYYLSRRRSTDSVMLAIGSGLFLLLSLFTFIYWQVIMPARDYSDPIIPHELMSMMISAGYFVSELMIAIGLLFLINKELRRSQESSFGPPGF